MFMMAAVAGDPTVRKFSCSLLGCLFASTDYNKLLNHFFESHTLKTGAPFICRISSCTRTFTNCQSFRRHAQAQHIWFFEQHMRVRKSDNISNFSHVNSTFENLARPEPVDEASVFENSGFENDQNYTIEDNFEAHNEESFFDESAVETVHSFLLELRERYFVTTEATCFLSEKLSHILSLDRERHREAIESSLTRNNQNFQIDHETKMVLKCESEYAIAFAKFKGAKALSQFTENKPEYVEPTEIVLGKNKKGGNDSYQYVPILSTLSVLLKHEDLFAEVVANSQTVSDGTLRDFKDGSVFKEHPLFNNEPLALQIILYHDDFNTVNPLGNKTNKHKTSAIYFVLGNLPALFRSRLSDINLLFLFNAVLLDDYCYLRILKPMLDDIKELETKGLQFEVTGLSYLLRGSVSMLIADNLAAHAIGGFYCNFSTVQNFCRYCEIDLDSLSFDTKIKDFKMRTKKGYDNNVDSIENDPNLCPSFGIKTKSCLNELNYFHVIDGLPPDLAHDCFEGFAVDLVTNVIVNFVKKGFFSLEVFNDRIENFPYATIDRQNKPQITKIKALTKYKVKQTACEMLNLLRLLPLMIGDLVRSDDDVWILFIEFLEIMERLSAKSFNRYDLIFIQHLLDEFFENYGQIFEDAHVKAKYHFLKHYPNQTFKYGPLIQTLRFESKNGYFKDVVKHSKNRINLCKTMATHHQMLMYLHYRKDNILSRKPPQGIYMKEAAVETLPIQFQSEIKKSLKMLSSDLLMVGKAVIMNGHRYSVDEAVVLSYKNDDYVFGIMKLIIFFNSNVFLLCQNTEIVRFDTHTHSYQVSEINKHTVVKIDDLLDYHPLGAYNISGQTLIPLRYYIPCCETFKEEANK